MQQHHEMHQHRHGTCQLTLDQLPIGNSATIAAVRGEGALRDRLLDMGLTPGTCVMVRKVAPMGDPMELNLRGYELTLRRSDAKNIDIVGDENGNRIGGESELREDNAVQSTDGFQPARGQLSWRHRRAEGRRHSRP
jgi:Fe2+ transport system protein FeoA